MRTILFTLLAFFFAGSLFAQESEPALASVSYEFIHINDTNNRDQPRREEMIVYLGQYASVYKSLTLANKIEDLETRIKEMGLSKAGSTSSVRISSPNLSIEQLFLMPRTKRLVVSDRIGDAEYAVDLKFPTIDWVVGNDTKAIEGYLCQQATGSFAGREYTVWFSTELPFPFGPWKLHGLPGLILEAQDSNEEVFFRFLNFDKLENSTVAVSLPSNAIKTRAKDFERAKQAFNKNPMIGRPSGAISKMMVVGKDGVRREISAEEALAAREKAQKENERKNNNPLELL